MERLALKADAAEPVDISPHVAPEISSPEAAAAPIAAAPIAKPVRRWLALKRGRL